MQPIKHIESHLIENCVTGSVFYTSKSDKDITALATYWKRKVLTERLVIVGGNKERPTVSPITKVTLI